MIVVTTFHGGAQPPTVTEYPLATDFETHSETGELSIHEQNRVVAVFARGGWSCAAEKSHDGPAFEYRS